MGVERGDPGVPPHPYPGTPAPLPGHPHTPPGHPYTPPRAPPHPYPSTSLGPTTTTDGHPSPTSGNGGTRESRHFTPTVDPRMSPHSQGPGSLPKTFRGGRVL